MDLTDEQWSIVSPLLPACPKRRDGRWVVRGVVTERCSMVFCGFSAPGRLGMTCLIAIRPTRPAIVDSNSGRLMAPLNIFCAPSRTTCMSAGALM